MDKVNFSIDIPMTTVGGRGINDFSTVNPSALKSNNTSKIKKLFGVQPLTSRYNQKSGPQMELGD
jgi:hypothetical protein